MIIAHFPIACNAASLVTAYFEEIMVDVLSNKNPSLWRENFNEDDSLLCALDRIFDDATVFNIRGESFRGKKLETIALQTGHANALVSTEKPVI